MAFFFAGKTSSKNRSPAARAVAVFLLAVLLAGCAALFGWDIHAPGVLSRSFYGRPVSPQRIALYFPPQMVNEVSHNKGGRFADPQTYHVGEALVPMLIEAFQQSFSEFILLETEPSENILQGYGIPYLVTVSAPVLGNRVSLKGQMLELTTQVEVYGPQLQRLVAFQARGSSDAEAVFSKKGGPEVNLNAAVERNLIATVDFLHDWLRQTEEAGV